TIDEILTETILLYPVTSKDGINFTNLVGSSISNTSGKYIQFSIYFKATSSDADDNFTYDIFLSGKDIKTPDGKTVTKTSIKSVEVNTIPLLDKMVLYNGTDEGLVIGPDTAQNFINVYTSNALRFSVQDTTPAVLEPEEDESQPTDPSTPETQEENTELETQNPQAIIYELTNDDDLGSYATDYNGDDAELNKLYNSKFNAGFTYYNSQRDYAQISAIKFEDKPTTIRTLDEELVLATVSSGSEAKMLTFRFWLEGWDADCFDGLSKSINVKLLFNSKKVK
ncbi:MAG: hypothetical protein IJA65_00845, partial [Acholeplasmatales bacterium]|nr:hypothetical protein [Acholeplasmatales bacterium]